MSKSVRQFEKEKKLNCLSRSF